jgi:hypothetical protein
MNRPELVQKIALFVGEEVDQVIVNTLVKQMLSPSVSYRSFRMGMGIAAFHSAYIDVVELLRENYQRFFILFETDTTDEYKITHYKNLIARPMKEYGLLNYVTFCPIVPNIGAWLLGKYDLPKKQFGQEFDLPKIEEVAHSVDINVLKRKNASFNQLTLALQAVDIQELAA